MLPTNFNEPFYGDSLSRSEYDLIAIRRIDRGLLAKESELQQTKWFDYRRMHPTAATYLCAAQFTFSYRHFVRKAFDFERAAYAKGFKGDDCMEHREAKTFWKLRQFIDSLGIRYDFYMLAAVDFCIRAGWQQPPRPAMLYSREDMVQFIKDAWVEEMHRSVQYVKDPFYRVENWIGHADQVAYQDFLLAQISMRQHSQYALETALYNMRVLRFEAVVGKFPDHKLYAAIEAAQQAGEVK